MFPLKKIPTSILLSLPVKLSEVMYGGVFHQKGGEEKERKDRRTGDADDVGSCPSSLPASIFSLPVKRREAMYGPSLPADIREKVCMI